MTAIVRGVLASGFLCLMACGGGGGGGGIHPLAGTWTGPFVSAAQTYTITIDAAGQVTQFLVDGSPSPVWDAGTANAGPDFVLTLTHHTLGPVPCPFLVDPAGKHAALVLAIGIEAYVAALERDAAPVPIWFEDDVIGSWSGYGTAYDQPSLGFKNFSPVTTVVSAGTPNNTFSTTWGATTITGSFMTALLGRWSGAADGSGAPVIIVMTYDKQFVAVETVHPNPTGLEDYTFFAMSRN